MGHVIADYPTPAAVRDMIKVMVASGVEVIEIQIPFSEPMADGPLFLAANHAALASGVDYAACLALMAEATRLYPEVNFVFMSYLNVVYRRGYARFVQEATASGASGVIIPDLPIEQARELDEAGRRCGFANVRLVAPNAEDERVREQAAGATGLVYAVARAGVTGAPSQFAGSSASIGALVERIRTYTEVPVAVGFGVRTPEDIQRLRSVADLAIVGTASLACYRDSGLQGYEQFWRALARATH